MRSFDLKNSIRSEVMETHEPNISSPTARTRDCKPMPPNWGGRSSDADRWSRSGEVRTESRVVAPTQLSQVEKCASYTDFIHSLDEGSFGTELRTWERRGITTFVSILRASLKTYIFVTSAMNSTRSVCLSSFSCNYCLINSGEHNGVPRMLIPSFSGQAGP